MSRLCVIAALTLAWPAAGAEPLRVDVRGLRPGQVLQLHERTTDTRVVIVHGGLHQLPAAWTPGQRYWLTIAAQPQQQNCRLTLAAGQVEAGIAPVAEVDCVDCLGLYVSDGASAAIAQFGIDPASGRLLALQPPLLRVKAMHMHALAVSADRRWLFANTRVDDGQPPLLQSYRIEPVDASLQALQSSERAAGGAIHPGLLLAHPGGRWLYDARFDVASSRTVFQQAGQLDLADIDAQTGFARWRDATRVKPAPAYGVIDPAGRNLYQLGESGGWMPWPPFLDNAFRLLQWSIDPVTGRLQQVNGQFDRGGSEDATAIAIDPSGRLLYLALEGSTFSRNKILPMQLQADSGRADFVEGAAVILPTLPTGLTISPDGRHLYVTLIGSSGDPGTIRLYAIDAERGGLRQIDETPTCGWPKAPTIEPGGRHLYLACSMRLAGQLRHYAIDPAEGRLTAVDSVETGLRSPEQMVIR